MHDAWTQEIDLFKHNLVDEFALMRLMMRSSTATAPATWSVDAVVVRRVESTVEFAHFPQGPFADAQSSGTLPGAGTQDDSTRFRGARIVSRHTAHHHTHVGDAAIAQHCYELLQMRAPIAT
eukprot:scaffold1591_cov109-Isochrysis_galbana.AAC.3